MAVSPDDFDKFILGTADEATKGRVLAELADENSQPSQWMREVQERGRKSSERNRRDSAPSELPLKPPKRRIPTGVWVSVTLAAGIAGLLVGRFLAAPDGGAGAREVVRAKVGLKEDARGPAVVAVNLDIESSRPGFATVVLLSTPLQTFPELDQAAVSVSPASPGRYGPIQGKPGTVMIIVITETPALEVIRRALEGGKGNVSDPKAARQAILDSLWQHNFRWAAVEETRLPG